MTHRKSIFAFAFILMIALLITGCDGDSDSETDEPTATTPAPATTESAIPTEEVVVTEEATATEEVIATPEVTPLVSVSADGSYYIAVSYTVDPPEEDAVPPPPEGEVWLIVVATLANQSGETVTVEPEHLSLIDSQDNRYSPEPPDDETQPPLVTAELAEGEDVLGLARFAIPENAILDRLEWCPGGDCEQALQADIP